MWNVSEGHQVKGDLKVSTSEKFILPLKHLSHLPFLIVYSCQVVGIEGLIMNGVPKQCILRDLPVSKVGSIVLYFRESSIILSKTITGSLLSQGKVGRNVMFHTSCLPTSCNEEYTVCVCVVFC